MNEQQATESMQQTADSSGGEPKAESQEPSAEEATLPPVPEGAILSPSADSPVTDEALAESGSEEETVEAPEIRLLGQETAEVDFLPQESQLEFSSVVLALVDAALDAGKGGPELNGKAVAEIFCRGNVEDPRVEFLLLLLAQDKPVGHELVLAAARATEGLEELVEEAVATREELERAGDVSVEQLGAAGAFLPLARALGAEAGA